MASNPRLQNVKKKLWYAGQELLDNPVVSRYVRSQTVFRDELVSERMGIKNCIRFGEQETVQYDEPFCVGELPAEIASRPRSVDVSAPFICELEDVQLVGPTALTLTSDGKYIVENSLGFHTRIEMGLARCLVRGILPVRRSTTNSYESVLSLVGPWCRNYYHWLIDYLTRLRYVKKYCVEGGKLPALLLPNEPSEWMIDGLKLAGFGDVDRLFWNEQRANVDRLFVPSLARNRKIPAYNITYGTSPSAVRWLRDTFRTNLPPDIDIEGPDRIYVSRQSASERRIQNSDAVLDVLEAYGFEAVLPENYSVAQQVALFSQADVVLGATGAGMINSIFGDDIRLIVLYGSDTHPVYYVLGQCLGFDVGVVPCTPAGGDLVVDPKELRSIFEQMDIE